jgi:hypothetical protein
LPGAADDFESDARFDTGLGLRKLLPRF